MIQVSIVVPMYNVDKYLEECLQSLLKQKVEKQIILIDDGSSDKTYSIAARYASEHPCISLICQDNSGQSVARNKGLKMATGEYVFFCDSDDYIDDDALKNLYELCKKDDLDYLKTGWKTCFPNGTMQWNLPPDTLECLDEMTLSQDLFLNTIKKWYNVIPWNGIYKRSWLIKNELFFPEGIQFEDNTYHLKVSLTDISARCMVIKFPFYNVRIRENSTTSGKVQPKKIYDILQNVKIMNDFIESQLEEEHIKSEAKRAVSSLVFTMTSYYYRMDKDDQMQTNFAITKGILRDAIKHSQTLFQKIKLITFTYCRPLLDVYENFGKING